jgi:UDP-N-acetyl-alpha-D-muramoyl-L-alanyl-L-glutamate epimerase
MPSRTINLPGGRTLGDQIERAKWRSRPAREAGARTAQRLENLFVDPPPRSHELIYEGYDLSYPDIAYRFRIRAQTFVHRIIFDELSRQTFTSLGEDEWAPLLHHIGLLFSPLHCRLTDIAAVRATSAPLPDDLLDFYEATSVGALAEFRYRFGLDPRRRLVFRSDALTQLAPARRVSGEDKVLLLNGGGKDCVVAAELLRSMGVRFAWFTLNSLPVSERVIAASHTMESYRAKFRTDPQFERHTKYRWFQTLPHTALISSVALVPAILHNFRFIAIANEYSANFPNRVFRGMEINHQYGKSYEFETRLSEMINRRLVSGVTYFSLLRPFYELRLGALFSRFDQYLEEFVSCNNGLRDGLWCKMCPKCAFVFLVLYPFLNLSQLKRVFGENLFHRQRIRKLILDLVRHGRKPWECVGTPEESQLALFLSLKKSPELVFSEWPYRQDLERACAGLDLEAATAKYLHGFHGPHHLPREFTERLNLAASKLMPVL